MTKYIAATVEGFTEYHEERGRVTPGTWDDPKIEASLTVASEWIDGIYGNLFVGQKTNGFLQDNEWPRIGASVQDPRYGYAFPTDEVPERVIHAVYEAAWRDANTPGSLLVDYKPNKYKSVAISGAVSVDYAMFSSSAEIQTTYPIIDQLLLPLLCADSNVSSYSGPLIRV